MPNPQPPELNTQLSDDQVRNQSTRALLVGLWKHLSRRRRIQLAFLPLVMLFSAAAETISLGAVLPFLSVLTDPERLWQRPPVKALAGFVGITQASDLVLPCVLAFVLTAVFAGLIRLANLWLNTRLAAAIGSDLSCEVYRRTLYQPYQVHLQGNSATTITTTTEHVTKSTGAINAFLQLITAICVVVGLLSGLVLINRVMTLGIAILFGSLYGILAMTARIKLRYNSNQIAALSRKQIQILQEGLGAIRDVILDSSQPIYLSTYRITDRPLRQLRAQNKFLSSFPRYIVETLGLITIALVGGSLVLLQGPAVAVIPLIGAFALGAQRLLPAFQQIYSNWSILKGFHAHLVAVSVMLRKPLPTTLSKTKPLQFRQSIHFDSVLFRYAEGTPVVLNRLVLEIRRGQRVALIGSTGSGKSTTVDLLMGLLVPSSGRLLVDGVDLHDPLHPERLLAWRSAIAHVPQSIYLADSSIAENIAFGVPFGEIDMNRVIRAAEQAQIASFIEDIPEGYRSFVGERGIRLSGGQRQRIGIARALYKQAQILVLDEATSALDTSTEEALMAAIEDLNKEITIVMIAHRLSTVQCCDRVIQLSNGTVSSDGPPNLNLAGKN